MATGTLAPYPKLQFFDDAGVPLAAGLLYTYAAGTSTPLTAYSDVGLTTPLANPAVLDAAGRLTIYLSATSYKFVLTTAAGATVWTADNISAVPATTIASSFNAVCDGRITLTSGTPVTSSDVTGATSVYFTNYLGSRIALFDGSQWNLLTFSELTLALGADAANTNNDLFAWNNAGAVALERVAWTNATTRATALVSQDGVLVKSGDTTRRYLGTYRTTSAAGQTEDSAAKRFVWNYYHRAKRALRVSDATDTWTYTTATFRQANASTANQVAVVVGVAEALLSLHAGHVGSNSAGVSIIATGIGEDSATAAAAGCLIHFTGAPAGANVNMAAVLDRHPVAGYHFYPWLEYSAAGGTTTWQGDGGAPGNILNGLSGSIDG